MSECAACGVSEDEYREKTGRSLDEHHTSYENDMTVPLCRSCHREVHNNEEHELHPVDEDPEAGTSVALELSDEDFEKLKEWKDDRGLTWKGVLKHGVLYQEAAQVVPDGFVKCDGCGSVVDEDQALTEQTSGDDPNINYCPVCQ
jgi:hypothetical protein